MRSAAISERMTRIKRDRIRLGNGSGKGSGTVRGRGGRDGFGGGGGIVVMHGSILAPRSREAHEDQRDWMVPQLPRPARENPAETSER